MDKFDTSLDMEITKGQKFNKTSGENVNMKYKTKETSDAGQR